MALFEQLDDVAAEFCRLVAATSIEAFDDPTPCAEWTIRLLINHVVAATEWYTCLVDARPTPDLSADQLGHDPVSAFSRRHREFREALSRAGALDATHHHSLGELSGSTLLKMRATEYIVHGWDLSRATGQIASFPDDLCLTYLEMYRDLLAGRVREPTRGFGVALQVVEDAPPLDRLVAFFGRSLSAE
jgi:uncharacterized protein (TIGR03086 family)